MGLFKRKKQEQEVEVDEDDELEDETLPFHLPDPMLEDFEDPTRIPMDFFGGASGSSVQPLGYMGAQSLPQPLYYNATGTVIQPIHGLAVDAWMKPAKVELSDDVVDQIWKKMYERPVIVRCSHCNSHNVITNPTCIQCGAPMGDFKEMKKLGGVEK